MSHNDGQQIRINRRAYDLFREDYPHLIWCLQADHVKKAYTDEAKKELTNDDKRM